MNRPSTRTSKPKEITLMRLDLNLSQEKLALILGVSAWTVMRYETDARASPPWYIFALKYLTEHSYNLEEATDGTMPSHKTK